MQNNAANSSETSMATQPGGSVTSRAASESRAIPGGSGGPHHDSATVTGAKFRHGLLQLMIHTIDPMHDGNFSNFRSLYYRFILVDVSVNAVFVLLAIHKSNIHSFTCMENRNELKSNKKSRRIYLTKFVVFVLFLCLCTAGKVDEKATQLHAIASLKVLLDATKPQRGAATSTAANNVKINFKETTLVGDRPNGNIDTTLDSVKLIWFFFFSIPAVSFHPIHCLRVQRIANCFPIQFPFFSCF